MSHQRSILFPVNTVKSILSIAAITAAMTVCPASQAATVIADFSWTGGNGYSATGSFSYDPATTPVSFSEAPGAGPTTYLQSFSVSFFDPQHTLLESGSSVVNGVSSDRFFRLDYNTQSRTISSLDGDVGGSSYQYFLTNLRTPDGQVVSPGMTGFNFFYRPNADNGLDSASSVQITSVSQTPEPATLSLFALVGSLAGLAMLRRSKSASR